MINRSHMKGSALIAVLSIVAIASILTAGIMTRLRTDILRTHQLQFQRQALMSIDGAILWANTALEQDWHNFTQSNQATNWDKIHWEQTDQSLHIEATIEDAQGRFNLNNLRDPSRSQSFVLLLRAIDPSLSSEAAASLTQNIQAWLSTNSRDNATIKSHYTQQQPAYLPASQLFVHSDELMLVDGITNVLFKKLHPFMIALPQTTAININTASDVVLMSLGKGLSLENANKLILLRQQLGSYKTSEQFLSNPAAQSAQITANQITLSSDYFILHTIIIEGNEKILADNLLKRQNINGKIRITRLWQKLKKENIK